MLILQGLVDRGLLRYNLSFVHQFTFADVRAVANVHFTGG
jgi:hypothetical protein